ncbi:MAG: hypothetical protein ACHQ5A_08030 [Opitutales bacterium]
MKNEEAKFILSAYRSGGADAGDATFGAALAQARSDPMLGAWFEFEQKFDRLMTAKLGAVTPPAGLREAILTGARVSSVPPSVRPWWQQTLWMASAAGLALLLTVGSLLLWPARADARELARFAMLDTAEKGMQHHGSGDDNAALQAALQNPASHLRNGVSVDFARLSATGCRTLQFAGHDVLEVCFQRNGTWFHCYIVRRADFSHATADPEFCTEGHVCCASWTSAEHIFIVVSTAGTSALKQLL